MGTGRAPTALEYYLLKKNEDTLYHGLNSISERAKNYSEIHGVSVEEATEIIKYNDTHQS